MSDRIISGHGTLNGEDLGDVRLRLIQLTKDIGSADKVVGFEIQGLPGEVRTGRLLVDDGPFLHEFPHVVDGCAVPDLSVDEPEFYVWHTKQPA